MCIAQNIWEREKVHKMPNKPTPSQIAERIIYIFTVILAPSIPLFFLYSRNAEQELLFKHFLIMGGVLAVISLVIYLLISKLFLRRRRTMIIIALFWSAFWFFNPLSKIIARGNAELSQVRIAAYLLIIIAVIGFIFRFISMDRLVANTIAVLLCLMFAYNFFPSALLVSVSQIQKTYNKKKGILSYEIKKEFNVDTHLSKPNIYWLHMDAMMGFDIIERYFNDPQTTLKKDLAERGFVINKSARLEAGGTRIAIPAMTCPVFFDSYLGSELTRVVQYTRKYREKSIYAAMTVKGFSFLDIYPQIEIFKAFSDAGYINFTNSSDVAVSKNMDIWINNNGIAIAAEDLYVFSNESWAFGKLIEFKELITDASALFLIKPNINKMLEKKRPVLHIHTQPLPAYQETVDKYVNGYSDSDNIVWYNKPLGTAELVKATKYATSIQTPHFVYFSNVTAHQPFCFDENGNYKEQMVNANDFYLYLPQHKFAVKQMIAQIDTIIENDPEAVIILQADHGIHIEETYETLYAYGYNNMEDQLNINFSVISAVRIPSRYGKLSQPLDPLDMARYLVNNFVGKGNYDYLYYKEENSE